MMDQKILLIIISCIFTFILGLFSTGLAGGLSLLGWFFKKEITRLSNNIDELRKDNTAEHAKFYAKFNQIDIWQAKKNGIMER